MPKPTISTQLQGVLRWYFQRIYRVHEGPGIPPWYCNPARVGYFALDPAKLRKNPAPEDLFKLFVTMTMYQALRDVIITQRQRAMNRAQMLQLASLRHLSQAIDGNGCFAFQEARKFPQACTVYKRDSLVDCASHRGQECPVKKATALYQRMGDLGKLPISAVLLQQQEGLFSSRLSQILSGPGLAQARAEATVLHISQVFRVGTKLAAMWTSALSTPSLAPGLTPLYPALDGEQLVVIDTNVKNAIRLLCLAEPGSSYQDQANWIRRQAKRIDLQDYDPEPPSYSPRLLQQALYWFLSRSNRQAVDDPCSRQPGDCQQCAPRLCPFFKRLDFP